MHLDSRLNLRTNSDAVLEKGTNSLCFLRRLRTFNVCSKMLKIFYQSVVASALLFAAGCWGRSIRADETNRLKNIIRKALLLVASWTPLRRWRRRKHWTKLSSIMKSVLRPLHRCRRHWTPLLILEGGRDLGTGSIFSITLLWFYRLASLIFLIFCPLDVYFIFIFVISIFLLVLFNFILMVLSMFMLLLKQVIFPCDQ